MYLLAGRNIRYMWILTAVLFAVGLIWLAFGHAAIKSHVVGDAALRIVSSFYAALLLLVRSRCSGDNCGYLLFGLGCLAYSITPFVALAVSAEAEALVAHVGLTGGLLVAKQLFFLLAVGALLRKSRLGGLRTYFDILLYTTIIVSLYAHFLADRTVYELRADSVSSFFMFLCVASHAAVLIGLGILFMHGRNDADRSILLILAGMAFETAAIFIGLPPVMLLRGEALPEQLPELLRFAGMMLLGMAALFAGDRIRAEQRKEPGGVRRFIASFPLIGIVALLTASLFAFEHRSLLVVGTVAAMLLLWLRLMQSIHEFRALEGKLYRTERTYRNLVEHALIGVMIERNGVIVYANPYCARTLGIRPMDIIGRSFADFVVPEDRNVLVKALDQLAVESVTDKLCVRAARPDGERVHLDIQFNKIVIFGEVAVSATMLDITERKQAEERALHYEKLSIAGQLAAGIAHEIRNPLTALKGFAQLMSKSTVAHNAYIDIMLSELERINCIVNEFMMLSKPQQLQLPGIHDIRTILRDILPIIETQAVINNVVIHVDWEAEVPPIHCDHNQIKQVFVNLIKNAIEAMPNGGKVAVTFAAGGDKEELCVSIQDEGPGIAQENIPKLGEPFFSTKNHGTGLGLMVCRRIIEAHGGTLRIQSEVNRGTLVEFGLPLAGIKP